MNDKFQLLSSLSLVLAMGNLFEGISHLFTGVTTLRELHKQGKLKRGQLNWRLLASPADGIFWGIFSLITAVVLYLAN